MSNLNELKPIISLNPFARFCCTIGNLPSSYMASLTYEEQLLWFCDYLQNTVIPAVNNNAEVVKELQELYVKLKNYVDNYFKNLDVQEEINNKLDKMAQSGELDQIVGKYITADIQPQINEINRKITEDIQPQIDELNLKDTIMIGDSFIQMFPSDNWALSLKNKLGLSDNQVYIFGEGGAGMFNPRECWT